MRVFAATVCILLGSSLHAQDLTVSLVDGTQLRGRIVELSGDGGERSLVLTTSEGRSTAALRSILALHGPPPHADASAQASLVGGDMVQGEITGGDSAGESIILTSRSLGAVPIAVDRLRVLLLRKQAGDTQPEELQVPADAHEDEAVFRKLRRGFEPIVGAIYRFTEKGVQFAPAMGQSQPMLYLYQDLVGVALRRGTPPATAPAAKLITRAGDVVGVTLQDASPARLLLVMEGGRKVELPLGELASLTFLGAERRFLSDLEPTQTKPGSYSVDGGESPYPYLYPMRKDRSVTGGFLVAGGLTYGKGLGVHGGWSLTYVVPEPCTHFHALVGLDDEVLALPRVRGDVDVRVTVNDKEVFAQKDVRSGQPPRNLGLIDVHPGDKLTLEVGYGKALFLGDRTDWLCPVFLK